jgi:hypothetical protein
MSGRISVGLVTAVALGGSVLASPIAHSATAVPSQCIPSNGGYFGPGKPKETGPVAKFTIRPSSPEPGVPITFDASSSRDADGDTIIAYRWNFGDGTPAVPTGRTTVVHTFSRAGTYAVSLAVLDCRDTVGQSAKNIAVGGSAPSSSVVSITRSCKPPTLRVTLRKSGGYTPYSARVLVNGRTRAVIHPQKARGTTTIGKLGRGRLNVTVRVRSTGGVKLTARKRFARCK